MATLTLTVLRSPDTVSAERRQVSGGELTIGRGADSDWTLADPAKSLSRRHCTLRFLSGAWQVQDLSVNGTYLNFAATPIGREIAQPLQDGDRLRLGDYEIEARIEQALQQVDDTLGMSVAPRPYGAAPLPFGASPSPFGAAAAPFGAAPEPLPFGASDNPFGAAPSPFGAEPNPFGAAPSPFGGTPLPFGDAARPGFAAARLPGLDDPVDRVSPFGAPAPSGGGVVADHTPAASDAFVPPPYVPAVKQLVPDDWFNDVVPAAPAPAAMAPRAAPRAEAFQAAPDYGPTVQAAPGQRPGAPAVAGYGAGLDVTTVPPRPAAAPPVAPAPVAGGGDLGAALATLMAGGELPPDMMGRAAADPAAALRSAGALLNAAVSGIRALLIARGSVKREFRIEQTMLRRKENNPLKFAASDEHALAALLDPRIDALAFLHESINDLTLHQVAVLAATQAAARALLEQLEPARLVAADPGGGLLPGAQEKRLWEAYKRRHAKLLEEFEDDFESAFGTAFARAYEQAVERDKG